MTIENLSFTPEDKVQAILNWADGQEGEEPDCVEYVKRLKTQLDAGDDLTEGQETGLDSLLKKHKIDVDEWLDA